MIIAEPEAPLLQKDESGEAAARLLPLGASVSKRLSVRVLLAKLSAQHGGNDTQGGAG
jgi:hypothetical protein